MSLVVQDTIKRLESYNESAFPILSFYFHPIHDSKNTLQQMQEFLSKNLDDMQKTEVGQNIEYMQGFMQKYEPKYPDESVAVFSGDNILFEIIHLPYPIENTVRVSHSPFLTPILEQQATYRRYLVILVDKAKAKFFTLTQGTVEEQGEVYDPSVPQTVNQDASEALYANREDKINRHIQDHLHRHFALIGRKVQTFVGDKPIQGVIIGGHKMFFRQFEKYLPQNLREKVVGEFVSELHGNVNELIEKSIALVQKIDRAFTQQEYPAVKHR